MSEHYVVVESVTQQSSETAFLEISCNTLVTATVTLRDAGGSVTNTFEVTCNADHYGITSNIFGYSNNQSRLAVITASADLSVVLRHTVVSTCTATIATTVPKASDARASTISFPTGSLGSGAHAMVCNPNGSAIQVSLRYGSPTSSPVSTTAVAGYGFAFIDITNDNANAVLSSYSDFFVQYLVRKTKSPFMESYAVP
jgi:hypothetical protein